MPSLETLTAYSLAIAPLVALVIQTIKDVVINPRMADTPARTSLLQAITYILNLVGLLGVLAALHQLDGSQALVYLSLAFGQSVVSHVTYSRLSTGAGTPQTAEALADVVTEPPVGG
jgi:hypothetical protein